MFTVTKLRNSTLPAVNWLSVEQVAEYFSVGKMTIYRWIHAGELPAVQVGRQYRIDEEAVKNLVKPVVAAR